MFSVSLNLISGEFKGKIMTKLIYIIGILLIIIAGCQKSQVKSTTAPVVSKTQTVNVELDQWYIKLNPATVNSGTVTFMIKNSGTIAHSFEIKGAGLDKSLDKSLQPGDSAELTVDLQKGSYTVLCPIDNHQGQGMVNTLTVK